MKTMLEKIYAAHVEEEEEHCATLRRKEKELNKEWNVYNALHNRLSKDDAELFNDYVDTVGFRHCDEEEIAYRNGFVAGALLMVEIFTEK